GAPPRSPPPRSQEQRTCESVDSSTVDPLVSPEAVLPDIEDRNQYLHEAPSTENGLRSAAFLLRPQPGMIEARHSYVVTFTFACSGTFVNPAEPDPVMANTGGPNGSFTSLSARTHD